MAKQNNQPEGSLFPPEFLKQLDEISSIVRAFIREQRGDLSGMFALKIQDKKIIQATKILRRVSENLVLLQSLEFETLKPGASFLYHILELNFGSGWIIIDTEDRFKEIYSDYLREHFLKIPNINLN